MITVLASTGLHVAAGSLAEPRRARSPRAFYRVQRRWFTVLSWLFFEVEPLLDSVVGVFYRSFYRVSIFGDPKNESTTTEGYVARKRGRYFAVIYEGLDPVTGKERRRWHPAGTDRAEAEALAGRLAVERDDRNDEVRSLTFGAYVTASGCRPRS